MKETKYELNKNRHRKRLNLIIILFLVFFAFLASNCMAKKNKAEIDKKKRQIETKIKKKADQLKKLKKKLRFEQYRLNIINKRECDLARQLASAHYRLKLTQDKLEQTRIKLAKNQKQLEITREKLLFAKTKLDAHKNQLITRLQDIYENEDINYLSVLLKSENFSDFLNRADFLRLIVNEDRCIIGKFKKREKLYIIQKAKYQKRIQENIKLKQKLKNEEKILLSLKSKRRALLDEVIKQRKSLYRYVVELEHSSHELERQIESLILLKQSLNIDKKLTSPYGASGRFSWPTKSRYITSKFGWRRHPIYGRVKFHSGIDIGAKHGSHIVAVANGVIIHSGWLGGYGKTVIIDHGGGYSTLYGHCSKLYVSEGQIVRQGECIALVGSTGISTGPHLHFEVRYKGKPIDPYSKLR